MRKNSPHSEVMPMLAAVAEKAGAPLAVRDIPTPEVGPADLLIRIGACGVCYTDLRIVGAMGAAFMPLVPGHEPVGTVVSTGADVREFTAGDRIAVHALFTCGVCELCLAGEEEACVRGILNLAGLGTSGGYSEFMRLPASHAVRLPDALSFAEAAPFCCAGLTTYAALKNGGMAPGKRVAVLGIGGLGHLGIAIAKAMGGVVYAVTSSPDKRQLALDLGASFAGDAASVVTELQQAGGAHIALHTANGLDPVGAILPAMAKQGAIVLTSGDGDALPIPPGMFTGLQLRVIGSFYGSHADLVKLFALVEEHHIRPIIEEYPLSEVNAVHDRLRAGDVRYRAVLVP
jgi:D-arabinose 1-dehydrogenase-like Zn-dependent alcohol dehydrogenase